MMWVKWVEGSGCTKLAFSSDEVAGAFTNLCK